MKITLHNKSNYLQHQRFHFDFLGDCINFSEWQKAIDDYDRWNKRDKTIDYIPKIIHQIWIGGKLPAEYACYQKTWKKLMPEFKYKMWGEQDILCLDSPLKKLFRQTKNPGAKSDIARYMILEREGGLYVDMDFECIKNMSSCLIGSTFICGQSPAGKENGEIEYINALLACTPNNKIIKKIIANLQSISKINETDAMNIINATGPGLLTDVLNKSQKDETVGCTPSNYFYPWPSFMKHSDANPKEYCEEYTYALHHWGCSWFKHIPKSKVSIQRRIKNKIKMLLNLQ